MTNRYDQFLDRYPPISTQVNGEEWTYHDTGGRGPVIVLLPGGQGTGAMFYEQLLELGEHYRMIAVGYPGLASANQIAMDLLTLLEDLIIDRATLVGSSLGGYVAQIIALHAPQQIQRLVLASTFSDCSAEKRLFPSESEALEISADAFVSGTVDKVRAIDAKTNGEAALKAVIPMEVGARQSAEQFKKRILCVIRSTALPPLGLDDKQIAIIDCADDSVITEETRNLLRSRHPNASIYALEYGDHYPAIVVSEQFNAILAKELEKIPTTAGENRKRED